METELSERANVTSKWKSEILFLLSMCIPSFFQNVISSINGPLYPPEADSKGLSPATYSLVLSFFRFMMLVGTPILAVYMEKIGLRRGFVLGVFLNGFSPVLFGLLDWVDSYSAFLILSFIFRGMEGFGAVMHLCSMYMMTIVLFQGRVALAFGILQSSFLLGNSVGPLLGSLIASSSGFTAPYVVFGILQILASGLAAWILPNDTPSISSNIPRTFRSYWEIMKIPSVAIFIYSCVVTGIGPNFLEAVLEPNLRQFMLGKVEVGLLFSVMAIPKLAAPIWGHLIDILETPQSISLLGAIIMVTAVVLLGPFPGIIPNFNILVAGLVMFGLAQGIYSVSSISNLRLAVIQNGIEESVISIHFVCFGHLIAALAGATIGPLIAGILYQEFGFQDATLFLIVVSLLLTFMILGLIASRYSNSILTCGKQKDKKFHRPETESLLKHSSP